MTVEAITGRQQVDHPTRGSICVNVGQVVRNAGPGRGEFAARQSGFASVVRVTPRRPSGRLSASDRGEAGRSRWISLKAEASLTHC
jgi:hypothetical protein